MEAGLASAPQDDQAGDSGRAGPARGGVPGHVQAAVAALALLAGTALQLQQGVLWEPAALLALVGAGLAAAALSWRGSGSEDLRRRLASLCLLAGAVAALAFAVTSGRAALRLAEALPPALEGRDLLLTGVVVGLPRMGPDGARFEFRLESATLEGEAVELPSRLWLGWWRGPDGDALLRGPPDDFEPGQRWRFTARLRQPHGARNPHGFDYELWLFERGIRATGSVRVRPSQPAEHLDEHVGAPVQRLRHAVRVAIAEQVESPALAGVLAALAIGDQAAIDRAEWEVFRATGVAHLMAISGLHVTLFAWLAGGLIAALWRRHPRLPVWLPAPVAARWGGLACAAAYAVLAGWGVPAQRTVWMLATVVAVRSSGRQWPLPAVLLTAAVVVSAVDPWALLQPGFWLSFVAVGLLVASEPVQARQELSLGRALSSATAVDAASAQAGAAPPEPTRLRRMLAGAWRALRAGVRQQGVATVGLAPLTLLFFQQVSVVGLLANLVAIPVVTLLITPLTLLGMLLPSLWTLAAALLHGLMTLLQALADWPLALWHAAVAPPWAVVAGLLAGLLAVLPLPWRLRALALPMLLPLLVPAVQRPPPGHFELVVVDIGQGTAVLVRSARHLLVYDTGARYSRDSDAGSRVLLPLLRARGERRIHRLVLSHRDLDHVGGAESVLAALPVDEVLSSLSADHPLHALEQPHRRCVAGQRWQWDGVDFEMLHPLADEEAPPLPSNAVSCVLRVQGVNGSVLLTGDIEAAQERALLARSLDALRADVLLVPHHGSRTSSAAAFIAAVSPRVAVVQAAYRSRYGHPAPLVLSRYAAQGVPVVRTDQCGAWTWPAVGPPVCERLNTRRYWHHPEMIDAAGVAAGAAGDDPARAGAAATGEPGAAGLRSGPTFAR